MKIACIVCNLDLPKFESGEIGRLGRVLLHLYFENFESLLSLFHACPSLSMIPDAHKALQVLVWKPDKLSKLIDQTGQM